MINIDKFVLSLFFLKVASYNLNCEINQFFDSLYYVDWAASCRTGGEAIR